MGPDYSAIDSGAKIRVLVEKGELVPMLLFDASMGGTNRPENVVFVPAWVVARKAEIDETVVKPMVLAGKGVEYACTPRYEGNSFVPNSIEIVAANPGRFELVIDIWGTAIADATR